MNLYIELRSARILFVATAVAALLAVQTIPAQELTWGGTIDGTGSATFADHQDETDTALSLTTALWLRSLFTPGDNTSIELDVQPSYTWTDDRPYLFDVDRAKADLRVSGLAGPSSVLRGSLGRFRFTDASGHIFTDTADGMDVTLSVPLLRARLGLAYTGLLLNPVSNIRMSATDDADSGDDDLYFGPRRFIALTEVTFPAVLLRQSATVAYIGQWDLRDADEDEGEDTLNSHYIGLKIDGPIVQNLFHDVSFYISPSTRELADDTERDLGILTSARLRYFRQDWNSSRFSLGGVIVSGAGDKEDNFYTISSGQAAMVADLPLLNVGYGELSYGVRPFAGAASRTIRDIQTTLTGRTIFRMSDEQAVDSFGANVSDDGRYVGTEASLQIGWRVFSDLGTSITGGAFFPGTGSGGAFTEERKPEYLLRMQVSASF
jgi:hypothetical protein